MQIGHGVWLKAARWEMRVVIAPDKFKGSLSAEEVSEAIERGFLRVDPAIEVVTCPMADGGGGHGASGGRLHRDGFA